MQIHFFLNIPTVEYLQVGGCKSINKTVVLTSQLLRYLEATPSKSMFFTFRLCLKT